MNLKKFLRPTKLKIILFAILIIAGLFGIRGCNIILDIGGLELSWILPLKEICLDAPSTVEFIPGIYPPILFEERLQYLGGTSWKTEYNSFAYDCSRASCGFCTDIVYRASCRINIIVPIYVFIYWYFLSCLIYYFIKFIQPFVQKNIKWITIYFGVFSLLMIFLASGIHLNVLGIILFITLLIILLYLFSYFKVAK
ncbi:MAG: hypothetical protein QXX38_02175 [Candidatus Aenigmatarchaeota archaeon]